MLSSLNQTINLFLPTISGLGAGTFFFYYSYHIYLVLSCASSKQVYGGVGKWSSPRERRQRSKEDTRDLSRSGSQTWFHCCVMLLLFQQRGKKNRTQSSGDLSSKIINKFTSSNIPIPGDHSKSPFLFLIPFTHHTARPFWHTSGLLLHCSEAVLTGACNHIHVTAWPSEWDIALDI